MSITLEPQPLSAATDLPPAIPLKVMSMGVVSAAGFGLDALADVLAGRAEPQTEAAESTDAYPPRAVRPVPPFDAVKLLGRKGTRNLDRLTRIGLIAANGAIGGLPGGLPEDRRRTGAVIGTTTGSITTATEVGRDTLVSEKPYMVNPATFPNTVMNTCSGQIAIRNSLLGVNAALSGGKVSGLLAVRYARTALTQNRADRLLVGAVEELSERTAWAWHKLGVLAGGTPLGEGAAVAVVERAGADGEGPAPVAELLGCEVGYFGGRAMGPTAGLARCIRDALARSGLGPGDVDVVAPGANGHATLAKVEATATAAVLGTPSETLDVVGVLGEAYSAGTALQTAALVAHLRGTGRVGLVTTVDVDGNAGALLVRVP